MSVTLVTFFILNYVYKDINAPEEDILIEELVMVMMDDLCLTPLIGADIDLEPTLALAHGEVYNGHVTEG